MNETILVVDDELANLRLVDKLLRSQGYTDLMLISDPTQVIKTYQRQQPDLILLDVNMPGMDGYEVLQGLRDLEDPLMPPIVMLTAQHSQEHRLKALSLGARDFITKPFDRNELLMRVRNLLDAQLAHKLTANEKSVLAEMVEERTRELHNTRLKIVQRLGRASEYRDEETGNHILRMSYICALLAKGIGWSEEDCDLILNASPMHDVGKIGIPDGILLKPGKLDPDEWEIMKTHVNIGGEILGDDDSALLQMAYDIAMTHHERFNGTGYPNGLAGEDIPMAGRIAALSDVFDALTSERPYKKAWPVEEAVALIKEERGQHFDPQLVDVFLELLPEIIEISERYADSPA